MSIGNRVLLLSVVGSAFISVACGADAEESSTSKARAVAQSAREARELHAPPPLQGLPSTETPTVASPSPQPTVPSPTVPPPTASPPTVPAPTVRSEISPTPVPAGQPTNFPAEFLAALNAQRASRGLGQLSSNAALAAAASAYARYMGEANFFSHTGLNGSTPDSRVKASGYAGSYRGEALAAGQATPQAALASLLDSPSHFRILMDAGATAVGIGYYYQAGSAYGHYWVVVTGTP
jgi:uncharacterized protein YkwD